MVDTGKRGDTPGHERKRFLSFACFTTHMFEPVTPIRPYVRAARWPQAVQVNRSSIPIAERRPAIGRTLYAQGLPLPGRRLNYPNGNEARLLHSHARDW